MITVLPQHQAWTSAVHGSQLQSTATERNLFLAKGYIQCLFCGHYVQRLCMLLKKEICEAFWIVFVHEELGFFSALFTVKSFTFLLSIQTQNSWNKELLYTEHFAAIRISSQHTVFWLTLGSISDCVIPRLSQCFWCNFSYCHCTSIQKS